MDIYHSVTSRIPFGFFKLSPGTRAISPMALKISNVDGNIEESERDTINNYFVKEWGYDERFVSEGISFTESKLSDFSIKIFLIMTRHASAISLCPS